ncbi:MAG: lipid-A-disaccharide synthase [Pseudomonadales bacterium]|nr:lipid-A-disaccharide synthase [Pseudomonadales bacterium]
MKPLRIGIIAGEVSGDTLGAGLMRAIQHRHPDVVFEGIGGPKMIACGFNSLFSMERLSVMGFVEPLARLPELLRIKKQLETRFFHDPPDVFIGIDSPGFNLRIEQSLHDRGIATVHYVSPSVWAWGEKRIHKIARAVDLMLVLFPFETAIYEQHDIAVCFVGHPLGDLQDPAADISQQQADARQALGITGQGRVLALMPGSRRDEVNRLGSIFIATAKACRQEMPDLQFVLPCANTERLQQVRQLLSENQLEDGIHVFAGNSQLAMQAADLVLLASGTATLEAMLLKKPMVVCYRLAPLTWMLASRMVKVPYVSLPNLLAGERLVPEFLQHQVQVPLLKSQICTLLDARAERDRLAIKFTRIHEKIRCNAEEKAATAVLGLIADRNPSSSGARKPGS